MMEKKKEAKDETKAFMDQSNRVCRSVIAVIDTLTSRGAFKGEELSTIGQLRDQSVQLIQMAETQAQNEASS